MNKNLKDWVFSRIEFNACDCGEKSSEDEQPKRETRQNKRIKKAAKKEKDKVQQTWDYNTMVEHLKSSCKKQ